MPFPIKGAIFDRRRSLKKRKRTVRRQQEAATNSDGQDDQLTKLDSLRGGAAPDGVFVLASPGGRETADHHKRELR